MQIQWKIPNKYIENVQSISYSLHYYYNYSNRRYHHVFVENLLLNYLRTDFAQLL